MMLFAFQILSAAFISHFTALSPLSVAFPTCSRFPPSISKKSHNVELFWKELEAMKKNLVSS